MGAHSMFYLHLVELFHHTESSTILNYHMDVRGRAFVKDYIEVRLRDSFQTRSGREQEEASNQGKESSILH